MAHDQFDVYKIAIEDTNQINSRRQALDSLYTAIITLILSGDVYLAAQSQFDNWWIVALTFGVGIAGILVVRHWRRAQVELDEVLGNRYAFLRNLETTVPLSSIGATFITDEYRNVFARREAQNYRTAAKRLQATFVVLFLAIPVLLGCITFAITVPIISQTFPGLVDWLHMFVRPLTPPALPIQPTPSATPAQ